jgi:phasin family protein
LETCWKAAEGLDKKGITYHSAEQQGTPYKKLHRRFLMAQHNFAKLFDFTALMEIQTKNIEALTEANKLAFEGFQAAGQRQAELLSQIVTDTSSIISEISKEGPAEEKAARQAELVKNAYSQSVTNWQELAGIIGESSKEASDIVNRRVTASLTELKSALNRNEKSSAHIKAA